MTCPLLTRKLKQGAARINLGLNYRVLLFSFDPSDDAANLRSFHEREKLPRNWILVRAAETDIRRLSDFFQYSIMTQGKLLIHPNEIFLLDYDLTWRATLVSDYWTTAELRIWIQRIDSPGIRGWMVLHPEVLAWVGFAGLFLGVLMTIGLKLCRKTSSLSTSAYQPSRRQ